MHSKKEKPILLYILCILTIIGSIFTLVRTFIYETIPDVSSTLDYIPGWLYKVSSIGTLLGALIMLKRKKSGLYIYSAFQLVYIITVIYVYFAYHDAHEREVQASPAAGTFALLVTMLFVVPSILFLVLYWLKENRSKLT